ncbi:MAG: hypothetical protein K6G60_09605 [Lachnospiraceae bacterium]|nr:hypothetical protein [Lachnospiraceae bacterium]
MISFRKPLLVGKSLIHRKLRTVRRIKAGKMCNNVFLITDPTNPANLFDVIEEKVLLFPYYSERDIFVHGIAGSIGEAQEMLLKLTEEKYAGS